MPYIFGPKREARTDGDHIEHLTAVFVLTEDSCVLDRTLITKPKYNTLTCTHLVQTALVDALFLIRIKCAIKNR